MTHRSGRVRPRPDPPDSAAVVELRGGEAVALRNDFAARDLRSAGNHGVEVVISDPLRHELSGLLGLLGGLEETKRTQNAVAGLDEVIATSFVRVTSTPS